MSRYILSAAAKQDLRNIKNYMARFSLGAATRFLDAFEDNQIIFYRPIKNGIQVERVLSGYRDFEEIFNEDEGN